MRNQAERDTVTVEIVTTLLIFTLFLLVGAVPMVLVDWFVGEGGLLDALGYVVLGCASVAASVYLWRRRHP